MSLGEILVKQGLLSRGNLEAALADEQAKGSRLAHYLVEKGILTSDQLALGLAEQFGVPPALEADFVRADPSLRKRLVIHQAVELQAIPLFFTSSRRVAVAMANPANPRVLDRLAFILGATVDPMVTSELGLARQFELLYRVKRRRSVHPALREFPVPQQMAKEREGTVVSEPGGPSESSDIRPALRSHRRPPKREQAEITASLDRDGREKVASPGVETGGKRAANVPPPLPAHLSQRNGPVPLLSPTPNVSRPAEADSTLPNPLPHLRLNPLDTDADCREAGAPVAIMEDALCFTPTPLTFIPPRLCDPPPPSRTLSRHPLTPIVVPITNAGAQLALEQIRFATDQQDLSDNLFTFMRACFTVGAMFVVEGAIAQARFGFSGGLVRPEVEQLRFSLSLPSCLRIARSRRATFRGTPPPDGMAVQGPLWAAFGTEPPSDVLVSPVIVEGQVTLLLYAQGEFGKRINNLAASKIEQVCDALSSSLLRLAV